jgi:hypothetical protein
MIFIVVKKINRKKIDRSPLNNLCERKSGYRIVQYDLKFFGIKFII